MSDRSLTAKNRFIATIMMCMLVVGVLFLSSENLRPAQAQVEAQQVLHNLGTTKGCDGPKLVGQKVDCTILVANTVLFDGAGDTWLLTEVFDTVTSGTGPVRVPTVGNLPIVAVLGGTTCTPVAFDPDTAPISLALPCTIPTGGSVSFKSNTYVIQQGDPDPLADTSKAMGTDQCTGTSNNCPANQPLPFFAAGTTDIIHPSTVFTKTADPTSGVAPLTVTFTYTEHNDGDVPLTDVTVTDLNNPGCGPFTASGPNRQPDAPGDNDNLLEPSETWKWTCVVIFSSTGTFTNTAFARTSVCGQTNGQQPTTCTQTLGVVNTGDPNCVASDTIICEAEERDDATIIVTQRPTSGQPGNIKIIKDTVPNDTQNFEYTTTGGLAPSSFKLDDDGDGALSNIRTYTRVVAGSYTVTELPVPGFTLGSLTCKDPDNGTTITGSKANIDLDAGETIICTFKNLKTPSPCIGGTLASQPEDPISMTTTVSSANGNNKIAKTVHAEKQVFDCFLEQGNVPVIADVTIVAEIFEDMTTKKVIHKQVEVVTCVKRTDGKILGCRIDIPSSNVVVVNHCSEEDVLHPQEMNTVTRNGNGIVKTIEAQKEVFTCTLATTDPTDDKKVDIVIFTEIWEDLKNITHTPPDPTVLKTFLSMRCVIKIDTVTVEACVITQPQQIFP